MCLMAAEHLQKVCVDVCVLPFTSSDLGRLIALIFILIYPQLSLILYVALLSLTSPSLSPHLSFILSLPLLFSVCDLTQSQWDVHRRFWLWPTVKIYFPRKHVQTKQNFSSTPKCFPYVCVHPFAVGSPLREDSPVGSLYALSASSPEHSLSPPSSRHRIHRESPDLREPDDDHHTVNAPHNDLQDRLRTAALGFIVPAVWRFLI